MPPAHAHAHEDDTTEAGPPTRPLGDGPVAPADIDRVLAESADPASVGSAAPLRHWCDDLMLARDALEYAETVLDADVAILRHRLSGRAPDAASLVEDLPQVVSPRRDDAPGGDAAPAPATAAPDPGRSAALDPQTIVLADPLLSAHRQMAPLDLTSRDELDRVLGLVQAQLGEVGARHRAVEARLGEIRAVIVQRDRDGVVPELERPA